MASIVVWAFETIQPGLPAVGLFLDFFGAFIILAPEVPLIARFLTIPDRALVYRLISRLEQGETLRETEDFGFNDLIILYEEGLKRGDTAEKPYSPETAFSGSFPSNADEIEPMDEHVEFRVSDGGQAGRVDIKTLREWADNYTGEPLPFFESGAIALGTGFFFQFAAEAFEFYPTLIAYGFWIGLGAILYILVTTLRTNTP